MQESGNFFSSSWILPSYYNNINSLFIYFQNWSLEPGQGKVDPSDGQLSARRQVRLHQSPHFLESSNILASHRTAADRRSCFPTEIFHDVRIYFSLIFSHIFDSCHAHPIQIIMEYQSCPRVTFLGPDQTRRSDPRLPTKSLTRPDPRPDPCPICKVFNWIIIFSN